LQVGIYKVVRNLAGIAVNQVKDFTASLPKVVLEGAAKADAEKGAAELKEAGAKVKVA
jgi:large subunit ribosomal protein L7/L12